MPFWCFSRNDRSVLLASFGSSAARASSGVGDDRGLGRQPHPDQGRVDVDLHHAHLARGGQVLGVRERGADHEEGVAVLHDLLARPGAEQAQAAGGERVVVGDDHLPGQRLDDRGAERLGDGEHLVAGVPRPDPDQHRDLGAGVEHVGGAGQVCVGRRQLRQAQRRHARRRPARPDVPVGVLGHAARPGCRWGRSGAPPSRLDSALRTARSTTPGICCGLVTIRLYAARS